MAVKMEHPGDIDDTLQAEEARDELIKVTLAFWDYVKNSSDVTDKAEHYKLKMIPILDAKRESRRLVGDVMVNQNDVEAGRLFEDRIAYAGWDLDIHHPKGIYSGEEGSLDYKDDVPLNSVPYRSTYSRNIENLFMAGRCMSYSHVALGTVRVQATLATVGQAAGTAAALCAEREMNPREFGKKHIGLLQQELVKNDQTIQGIKNEDPNDLARKAKVTASSYEKVGEEVISLERPIGLTMPRWVMVSVKGLKKIDTVRLYLESDSGTDQSAAVQLTGLEEIAQHEAGTPIKKVVLNVPAGLKGWVQLPVNATLPKTAKFVKIALPQMSQVNWPIMSNRGGRGGRGYKDTVSTGEFHAVKIEPRADLKNYKPENVINGWTRLAQNPASMWRSDPTQSLPQWIELDFGKPTPVNAVQLTFVTDPNGHRAKLPFEESCLKDYEISAWVNGKWVSLVKETYNFQRFRVHPFKTLKAQKIRLSVSATHGSPSASLFEIRAYHNLKCQ
ncbi:MAG: FAD-dependent oxidoreductase [Kiritimatiellae bacterium]|nr:FAD-dependent oxidoreductase [Kiritimatiellia bacterium]